MDPIQEQTFGAEFEFLMPADLTRQSIAVLLTSAGVQAESEVYNHYTRMHWKVITDESLRSASGAELVSPVLCGEEGLAQIATACRVLEEAGCTVNVLCGFHVHVGAREFGRDVGFFKRLLKLYHGYEPVIDGLLSPSRRDNRFCRNVNYTNHAETATTMDRLRLAVGEDRFRKVNLEAYFRHGTIEFRQHQGTLDAAKACNWIRFCLRLCGAAAKDPVRTTPRQGGRTRFHPSQVIRVTARYNPHRYDSTAYDEFARYNSGMTVQQALERGVGTGAYLGWYVDRGHLEIDPLPGSQPQTVTPTLDSLLTTIEATEAERAYFAARQAHFASRTQRLAA
jgi:hypothetical protein